MSKITDQKEEWREVKPGEDAGKAWDRRMEHIQKHNETYQKKKKKSTEPKKPK
jgi:hypothetical protein